MLCTARCAHLKRAELTVHWLAAGRWTLDAGRWTWAAGEHRRRLPASLHASSPPPLHHHASSVSTLPSLQQHTLCLSAALEFIFSMSASTDKTISHATQAAQLMLDCPHCPPPLVSHLCSSAVCVVESKEQPAPDSLPSPSPLSASLSYPPPASPPKPETVYLDGQSLTPSQLLSIGRCHSTTLALTPAAWSAIARSRAVIDRLISQHRVVYGINTGFGNFSNVLIPPSSLAALQLNLIRSHAAGVGEPLPVHSVRMLFALRLNVLAKGCSGVSVATMDRLVAAFNANCLPVIPCQGTVGASGDLAPLAHLALGMLGEGMMYDPSTLSLPHPVALPASTVLQSLLLTPLTLHAKEGLALINGTQLITALGAEAVTRARRVALQADCIAAMTVEVLKGSARPFNALIQSVRPHKGQAEVAARLRSMLAVGEVCSEITWSHVGCGRVQDAYTLRCIPQIHGISHDTISWVHGILSTEMNSATDNPMVFADAPAAALHSHLPIDPSTRQWVEAESGRDSEDGIILSGGNFHGNFPAKALDFLCIAVHDLASVSERRIERLVNPQLSALPAFLTPAGGLNSGFMIAHCTAAALTSESKQLCMPASVDSISTSAAQEDHVSMGGWAARKCLQVVSNVELVLAIELLAVCAGLDMHRPLTSTRAVEAVWQLVRGPEGGIAPWTQDRIMSVEIDRAVRLVRGNRVWETVRPFMKDDVSCEEE